MLYETSWGPTAETGFVGTHVEVWQYPWDLEKFLHVLSPQKRSSMHFTQSALRDTLFECFVKNVEVVLQCPWHLKKEIFPRTFFFHFEDIPLHTRGPRTTLKAGTLCRDASKIASRHSNVRKNLKKPLLASFVASKTYSSLHSVHARQPQVALFRLFTRRFVVMARSFNWGT